MNEINEENNNERFLAGEGEYTFKINGSADNVAERMQQRNRDDMAKAMEKYMPIGSIVKTNESFNKYMIMGFDYEVSDKMYDYLACEYPYGVDRIHKLYGFNHEQIEKVFHIGFINNQEKSFKATLKKKRANDNMDR